MARFVDVPVYEDVKTWRIENVSDWLHQIGFYEFVDGFESQNIDGKRMLSLSEDELRRCYPNMRGGRSDPSADLMRQINKVKSNKKKGFLASKFGGSKRNDAPASPRRDYPTNNGHSQHQISQEEEGWPDGEFDEDDDETYDDPTPESQPNHPRSSSYHGSTGTTALRNIFETRSASISAIRQSSTTTGDSDQLYMDPAAEEDYGGTYEVPGTNPNKGVEEEDFDQTYDVVPTEDDVRRPQQPVHRQHMYNPPPQMHGRTPSPNRLGPGGPGLPPPRPMKSENLLSPARRDLPTVPQLPGQRLPPRQLPPPGGPRQPPRHGYGGQNGNQVSDSDDEEEYLVPDQQDQGQEIYEVANEQQPQHGYHLAPPHEEKRLSQQRLSQQSFPPPPDEEEQYVDPNDEEHGTACTHDEEVYVVHEDNNQGDDLYLDPSENQEEGGQDGELYIDPIEDPSNSKIQNRNLPPVPPSPGMRPPMPTPQDTPRLPQRPPKPSSISVTSSVPTPPAIISRPPKSPLHSNIPMPKVLPNPPMSSLHNRSRSEETPKTFYGQGKDKSIKAQDAENEPQLGERKLSGGVVSDMRQRFNNNNSDKPAISSPRPGSRPNIASRISSQSSTVQVPNLPTRTRPQPSPSPAQTRRPASPVEPDRPVSARRWPPVDTNKTTVAPPPIPKPIPKPVETKPPEPLRPVKPTPKPELPPAPSQRDNARPAPRPRQLAPPEEPRVIQPPPSPTPRHQQQAPKPVNELDGYPWYQGDLKREKAFHAVKANGQDGAFLVRNSEKGGEDAPYSLTLWYNNKVRNLKIRRRKDGKFALGNFKDNEVAHDSASQMIQYYQQEPVILARDEGNVILKIAVPIF